MAENVKLKDLYFGVSDGAVEAKEDNFSELFYDPGNKYEELMENDNKFIILGNKGSGKTYLASYVVAKKSDKQRMKIIDSSTKFPISKLIAMSENEINDDNVQAMCRWYILEQMAGLILENASGIEKWLFCTKIHKLSKFVSKYNNEDFFKAVKRIDSTSMTKENASSINSNIGEKDKYGIGAEDGVKKSHSKEVSYESIRKEFFEMIPAYEKKIFDAIREGETCTLLFDDLDEIYSNMRTQGKVIINLIKAAKDINFEYSSKCKIVLLLRTDMLDDLQGTYSNLSKTTESCSVELYWLWDSIGEQFNHPLINMVLHKVRACCDKYKSYDNKRLFYELFPEKVDGKNQLDYLLDHSFGRPRDIITFLSCAQKISPNSSQFTGPILKEARKSYADIFYNELLNQTAYLGEKEYVNQCLQLLNLLHEVSFSYEEVVSVYKTNKKRLSCIKSVDDALQFLYKLGAIGNVWPKKNGDKKKFVSTSWAYKKESTENVDYNMRFTIHYGLRKKFSLK